MIHFVLLFTPLHSASLNQVSSGCPLVSQGLPQCHTYPSHPGSHTRADLSDTPKCSLPNFADYCPPLLAYLSNKKFLHMFSKTAINCLYQNQCCRKALCILEWFLEQKKKSSGKLDEVWLSLRVYFTVMCPCWFLSFDEHTFSSVQLLSCLTLCDPMDCSTPGLAVHHQFPELTETHVHWVGDAIQPSHPLSLPSPPTSGSQFFASGGQSIGVSASASVFPMNIRTDFL